MTLPQLPNDCACVYPIADMLSMVTEMLTVMRRSVLGESVDEAITARLFGNKESMVQQLERLCDVLKATRALQAELTPEDAVHAPMGEEERALIRHYVVQLGKQYEAEAMALSADDA